DHYLEAKNLSNEFTYFDPTKVESNRECGLHI
ncbi:MAG: phosphoadenylylsulfate reductase, partial [Polaribacter sp.]|nr:phosphoadenylylsulfate reductase [Polaribacter sp.]